MKNFLERLQRSADFDANSMAALAWAQQLAADRQSRFNLICDQDVRLTQLGLEGTLSVPDKPVGVVIFAHGSGSNRHSPRNSWVAAGLQEAAIATLAFDLLTAAETLDPAQVRASDLPARRLRMATDWVARYPLTKELPIGYFGAGSGAAAALIAAAGESDVRAVVLRGGRPKLAQHVLEKVMAPTMLIMGGRDRALITRNREAYRRLRCEKEFAIVQGAAHLFEEPGALDQVVDLAIGWFARHLARGSGQQLAN